MNQVYEKGLKSGHFGGVHPSLMGYFETLDEEKSPGSNTEQVAAMLLRAQTTALLMNELRLVGPSFSIRMEQSVSLTIPAKLALVETLVCCPLLSPQFQTLARTYAVYRCDGVSFTTKAQNENWSTQTLVYDPLVSLHEQNAIRRDKTDKPCELREWYSAMLGAYDPEGNLARPMQFYLERVSELNAIPGAVSIPSLGTGQLSIPYPSTQLMATQETQISSPVLEEAGVFFAPEQEELPLFGKMVLALANESSRPVSLIGTITYHLVWKRRRRKGGYLPSV